MSQTPSIRDVLAKYESEALAIRERIQQCQRELESLHGKLQEVHVVMDALALANRDGRAPASASIDLAPPAPLLPAAPTADLPPAPASTSEPSTERRPGRRSTGPRTGTGSSRTTTSTGRKGRRKAVPSETNDINDLSIVEAAIELARQKGVNEADAGLIHAWFTEANYLGRSGEPPNRNSIFVSLNREYNDAMKRGETQLRVERPQRGLFRFNFEL